MATIKEKFEKVMEYTDATAEQLLNMCEAELNLCYASVEAIEAESKSLARRGIHLKVEEDCGCGGCEDALTKCLEIDASGMTPEEFIKTCFELLEGRFSDEVQ